MKLRETTKRRVLLEMFVSVCAMGGGCDEPLLFDDKVRRCKQPLIWTLLFPRRISGSLLGTDSYQWRYQLLTFSA